MKPIKLFCAIMCLILCCSCSRVSDKNLSEDNPEINTIQSSYTPHLLYCSTDSFNPFEAVTEINQELALLLFDPLIKLNEKFEPVYYLAKSATIDAKVCTVVINPVTLSDGSKLTADDVVFSQGLAKASGKYSQQLSNVSSCTASDSLTVLFTLSFPDSNFINLLDFPIIKRGSNTLVNEDKLSLPPIGCGRYVQNEAGNELIANEGYYGGAPAVKKIELVDAPDKESVSQRIKSGEISAYYSDLSDNDVPNMNGKAASVPLNNLVFIGCNMKSGLFTNVYARQAVSSAINRSAIAKTAYFGNAKAATGPFSTNWSLAAERQSILTSANANLAVENFNKLGYNKDDDGYYTVSKGKRLTVSLLVNSDNSCRKAASDMIVTQLDAIGIVVTVNSLPYDSYVSALSAGSFDLYIAEVRILNNMDLTPLVTFGGSCAYGIAPSASSDSRVNNTSSAQTGDVSSEALSTENDTITMTTAEAVSKYREGTMSLADMITVFNNELPIIPVCYRSGILLYNKNISTVPTPSVSDVYYNFEKFTVN